MSTVFEHAPDRRDPLAALLASAGGFASFLGVGGAAALAYVALSSALIGLETGLADWLVAALCYAGFVPVVYLLHRRFSFRTTTAHAIALPRYLCVQAGAVVAAGAFSFLAHELAGTSGPLAGAITIGLTSGLTFLVLKLWAFARD